MESDGVTSTLHCGRMVHLLILIFFIPSVTSTCFVTEQAGEKRKIIDRKTPLTIEQCETGCVDNVNCNAYASSLPSFCVHLGEVIGAGCIGEVNVKSDQCGVESPTTTEVATTETTTTPEVTTTTELTTTTTPTTPTTTTAPWNPVIPTCLPSQSGLWDVANPSPKYVKDGFILACANGPKLFYDDGKPLLTDTKGNHYPFIGGPDKNSWYLVCGMAKSDGPNMKDSCIDTWRKHDEMPCVDYTPPSYSRCCTPIVEKSKPIGDNLCGTKQFKSWRTSTKSEFQYNKLECTTEGWKAGGIIVYPFSVQCG